MTIKEPLEDVDFKVHNNNLDLGPPVYNFHFLTISNNHVTVLNQTIFSKYLHWHGLVLSYFTVSCSDRKSFPLWFVNKDCHSKK